MLAWTAQQAEAAEQFGPGDVHVWDIDLRSAISDPTSIDILDEEEHARAAHLRDPIHREEFLRAHVTMRIFLGRYAKLEASQLRFAKNPRGKPHLIHDPAASGIRFSFSRSDGRAALALSKGRDIGVDIERITDRGLDGIALRALAAAELDFFRGLPAGAQRSAFFAIWTRKEAFLKALGEGLAIAPAEVDTISIPGRVRLSQKRQRGWRVQDVEVAEGYAAAVAVSGFFRRRVRVLTYP